MGWHDSWRQYFAGTGRSCPCNVSQVIGSVVQALLARPERRFSLAEQAFFVTWLEAQPPAMLAQVKGLVARGQLAFLGGGWSMPDEACPTYIELLDNVALGQRKIAENFGPGALPTVAWQVR